MIMSFPRFFVIQPDKPGAGFGGNLIDNQSFSFQTAKIKQMKGK